MLVNNKSEQFQIDCLLIDIVILSRTYYAFDNGHKKSLSMYCTSAIQQFILQYVIPWAGGLHIAGPAASGIEPRGKIFNPEH
jgi:hypothetical protein